MTARAAITYASHQKCSRDLQPGELKRTMQRGPCFVGYYIACPACGFVAPYLNSDCAFVEAPGPDRPLLVAIGRPPPCYKCRRRLRVVEDGEGRTLEAGDP